MVNVPKMVRSYQEAGALHALFGIHRFLHEHVFLTKSGALGVIFLVEGIDPETLTGATLDTYTKRILNACRAFGPSYRLYQYLVKQDGARIEAGSYSHSIVRQTIEDRNRFLEAKGLYSFGLFFVLLLEPPQAKWSWVVDLFPRQVVRLLAQRLEQNQTQLLGQARAFQRSLGDLLRLELLPKQIAFQFFRLLTNLDPAVAAAERLKYDNYVDFYLGSSSVTCTKQGVRIGEAQTKIFSLKEPPTATAPTLLYDLLKLPTNFILCSEWQRVSNETAIAKIKWAQKFFYGSRFLSDLASLLTSILNRGKTEDIVEDETKLNDVDDLTETLTAINNRGEALGEYSLTAVLYDWNNPAGLETAASDLITKIGEKEGALIQEDHNALNAYLSILPGNTAFNRRKLWLLDTNYADLAFCYAPSAGERTNPFLRSEYLTVLETNQQTPYYLNLYESDDFGVLIFGCKGMGKSATAGLLLDNAQKYDPFTFILDVGGSYERITRKHRGSYVRMKLGPEQTFRINPFCLEDTRENRELLSEFVQILLDVNGYATTAADKTAIFEAIDGVYCLQPHQRTLTALNGELPRHLEPALNSWLQGGPYGTIFDNTEDTLTFSRFQCFDFQGMDELYPKVVEPLLFYLFARISQLVYDPALRWTPKHLWVDEAWRFLANGRAKKYLLSAGATWRKHNAGIALITQSLQQLAESGILQLANELWPTKILLPNPRAEKAAMQDLFGLTEEEWVRYQGLIPRQQFLLKRGNGESVVLNVTLDPATAAQYGRSAQEPMAAVAAFAGGGER